MNKIKELRADRGWSMQELADNCDPPTTASQINKLEKGRVQLNEGWMRRLAAALECYPLDLLDGGPERLKPRERKLVDLFRGFSDEQQHAFIQAADAVSNPREAAAADGDEKSESPEAG